MKLSMWMAGAMALLLGTGSALAAATPAGMFKRVDGEVRVERAGATLPASVGMQVYAQDTVVTGSGGSAGITFDDNTLMSLGPSSRFAIDQFRFNSTTHEGRFDSTLSKGRLAVVSGKIAKHEQDAMKVRTPQSILGVRGTEFIVEAE